MDWSKIRRAFHVGDCRPDAERESQDELEFRFRGTSRELEDQELKAEEALGEALRRLGDVRHYCRELKRMERATFAERIRAWGDTSLQVVSSALRSIRRNPGFSAAVIGTLALGLGANTAMFRIVDRLFLNPPEHVQDAEQVRKLYFDRFLFGQRSTTAASTYADYRDLREVEGFQAIAAYTASRGILGDGLNAQEVAIAPVSVSFFPLLGVTPALGRFFTPDEDEPGAASTAILSWRFWQQRFGADTEVLGRTLEIEDETYVIVGVAPRGFTGVELRPVDVWLVLEPYAEALYPGGQWRTDRGMYWLQLVVRLASDTSDEAAVEEATAVYRSAREGSRMADSQGRVLASSLVPSQRPDARDEVDVARWLGAVSFLVFLIACANVANLFLARGLRRQGELALRRALGIGRGRLFLLKMTEAGVLAVLGGVSAVLLASWSGNNLTRVLLPDMAVTNRIADARLLAFTGLAVLFAVIVAGFGTVLQSRGVPVMDALKSGGERTATGRTRSQGALLVVQATLAVLLVSGAAVFVKSLTNVQAVDLGFETDGLAVVQLQMDTQARWEPVGVPGADHPEVLWPPSEAVRLYELAVDRLMGVPGFRATLASPSPFGANLTVRVYVPGRDSIPRLPSGGPYAFSVGGNFFEMMGVEVIRGRPINPGDDRPGAPSVMVINESMAEAIWPDTEALGRCLHVASLKAPCATVVGVAEDIHRSGVLEKEPQMVYFVPVRQGLLPASAYTILTRASGDNPGPHARPDASTIRAVVQAVSPQIRFAHVRTFDELLEPELRPWRLGATVFSAFGLLALLVAGVGLYSVLSFDVAGRSRELGIRTAVGASRPHLLKIVAQEVIFLVGAGIALGFLGVYLSAPFLEPLLYEVSPFDPEIFMMVGGVLVLISLAATAIPASRAMRVDPVTILRAE